MSDEALGRIVGALIYAAIMLLVFVLIPKWRGIK